MKLDNYNKDQIEAILSESKNTLVIAGAGSGKTSVIVGRISHLINKGATTNSIFAVTFTNKAASEMKERIIKSLNKEKSDMSVGTFHSLFGGILRDNFRLTNLEPNYQVIDTDDQKQLIKSILKDLDLLSHFDSKEMRSILPKAVNQTIKYIGSQKDLGRRHSKSSWTNTDRAENIIDCNKVYELYELHMSQLNLVDYGDLLLYPYEIFKSNNSILKLYQDKYSNVLVDEFQDTNFIQYELVKMISEKSNLFIVGDDDQSIYGWRGAEIENILSFGKIMNAKVVKLEQNYRSTKKILKAANSVIGNNENRMGKNLWSDNADGDKITVKNFTYDNEESDCIATEIKSLIKNGINPNNIAVLYRNNSCSRAIEKSLNNNKIKYVIIGGVSFWKRSEIKDVISMMSLIENENNIYAFIRSIGKLTSGVGDKSIEKIIAYKNINKISITETLETLINNLNIPSAKFKLSKKQTSEIEFFHETLKTARDMFSNENSFSDVIRHFVKTDFVEHYAGKDTEEAYGERFDNLFSLIDFAENISADDEIESLSDFVNYAMLQSAADEKSVDNSIQMMTIHSSKGLEFEYVFLSSVSENMIPSPSAVNEGRLEEERRLFYVAITRAKKSLHISSYNYMYGDNTKPSQFISEIPEDIINNGLSQNNRHYYSSNSEKKDLLGKLYKGAKITHRKFGVGTVERYESDGNMLIIYANFKDYGLRGFSIDKKDLI